MAQLKQKSMRIFRGLMSALLILFAMSVIGLFCLYFYVAQKAYDVTQYKNDIQTYIHQKAPNYSVDFVSANLLVDSGIITVTVDDVLLKDETNKIEIASPQLHMKVQLLDILFGNFTLKHMKVHDAVALIEQGYPLDFSVEKPIKQNDAPKALAVKEPKMNSLKQASAVIMVSGKYKGMGLPKRRPILQQQTQIKEENQEIAADFILPKSIFEPIHLSKIQQNSVAVGEQISSAFDIASAIPMQEAEISIDKFIFKGEEKPQQIIENIDLIFKNNSDKISLSLLGALPQRPIIAISLSEKSAKEKIAITVKGENLNPQNLAQLGVNLPPSMPIAFEAEKLDFNGFVDSENRINVAHINLDMQEAVMTLGAENRQTILKDITLFSEGDLFDSGLKLKIGKASGSWGTGTIIGEINPELISLSSGESNLIQNLSFKLQSQNLQLNHASFSKPQSGLLTIEGMVFPSRGALMFSQAQLNVNDLALNLKAELPNKDSIYSGEISLPFANRQQIMSLSRDFTDLAKIVENIWQSGDVRALNAKFQLPASQPLKDVFQTNQDAITASAKLENSKFNIQNDGENYELTLPVSDLSMKNDVIDMSAAMATFKAEKSDEITLKNIDINIEKIFRKTPELNARLSANGTNKALFQLLDSKPLELTSRNGLIADETKGQFVLNIDGSMPVKDQITPEDLNYYAFGEIKNFATPESKKLPTLSKGSLTLVASPGQVQFSGHAVMDDGKIALSYIQSYRGKRRETLNASLTLTPALQKRFGVNLKRNIIGDIVATVQYQDGEAIDGATQVMLDLTPTRLSVREIDLDKPKGKKAYASFKLIEGKDIVKLTNFELDAEALKVKGDVSIGTKSGHVNFNLPLFQTSRSDNLSLKGEYAQDEDVNIHISGKSFDATSLLKAIVKPEEDKIKKALLQNCDNEIYPLSTMQAEKAGCKEKTQSIMRLAYLNSNVEKKNLTRNDQQKQFDFEFAQAEAKSEKEDFNTQEIAITAQIDEIIGLNGMTINDVQIALRTKQGIVQYADIFGRLNGEKDISITIGGLQKGREVGYQITGQDAGSFLKFLGIYKKVTGGKLIWRGKIDAKTLALKDGRLDASDLLISGEKLLNKLYTEKKIVADEKVITAVPIDRFSTYFRLKSSNDYYIDDAVLRNKAIGLTFEGDLNFAKENLSLRGVFTPLFSINNFFQRIPGLGALLGNRREEGLFGVTYKIEGKFSDPSIQINPGSLIAPGVFRRLFEFGSEDKKQ